MIKEKQFYARHAIYRLTHKGAQFTNLRPLNHIPLGSYHHTVALIELYLKLSCDYPQAQWLSERTLLDEKFFDGIGGSGLR